VASSFISPEQAQLNLDTEIGKADFDTIRRRAEARWDELLGRAKVEGGSAEQQRTFYSCLYRCILFPHKFYEKDGQGSPSISARTMARCMTACSTTDSGFWDTFRAAQPLYNLLIPGGEC